jgi:phosphoribosylformylglycinamidine synthase
MGQFVLAVRGIGDACRALDFPVVSGNVSLYNETNGQAILPTPAIGGVGLMADVSRHASLSFKAAGETILVIGDTKGHLGQSLYLRELHGREEGPPPPIDLKVERRNGEFVRSLIAAGRTTAVHDISDGGLLVAIAEMAMAGNIGADLHLPAGVMPHAFLFGEDQARYVLTVSNATADRIITEAAKEHVPAVKIGMTGGTAITVSGSQVPLSRLREAHEGWLPKLMAAA